MKEWITLSTNPISQHSVATALVQLLEEHPELSESMSWSISRLGPRLFGFIHKGGMEVFDGCVSIFGGSAEPSDARQYVLLSVWRDVPVEVVMPMPAAAAAVAA